MEKVLIISGATGVGKTSASIRLAKQFDMEVISADSVQVFKEFDIGSAKIGEEERQGVIHHGIDLISPTQEFTASDFVKFAQEKIKQIIGRGKTPMIVGGTGLYIKALVCGYNLGGTQKQEDFRQEMEKIAQNEGCEGLYARLLSLSPQLAEGIDRANKARLIRALEIATFGSGKGKIVTEKYDYKIIALTMPRDMLYERINQRSRLMIKKGLVEEVDRLYKKYGFCQPMRAIGYKEVVSYLGGEISKERMTELICQHTRNYAKRQLTFLRGMENVEYYDVSESDYYEKLKGNIELWLK